jgi:hypothetical protein
MPKIGNVKKRLKIPRVQINPDMSGRWNAIGWFRMSNVENSLTVERCV